MYTDLVGDLRHRQRLQVELAFLEKRALIPDDGGGDLEEGVVSLLNCVNNPLSGADVVVEEVFCFFVCFWVFGELCVVVVNFQIGQVRVG